MSGYSHAYVALDLGRRGGMLNHCGHLMRKRAGVWYGYGCRQNNLHRSIDFAEAKPDLAEVPIHKQYCSQVVEQQNVHAKLLSNTLICTFGSPLIGDSEFVRNFNRLRIRSWRIVNEQDIITTLPPEFWGFRHIKGLHSSKMAHSVVPTPVCFHDIKTYQHLLDPRQPLAQKCKMRRSARLYRHAAALTSYYRF
jgi:hypothetical protein